MYKARKYYQRQEPKHQQTTHHQYGEKNNTQRTEEKKHRKKKIFFLHELCIFSTTTITTSTTTYNSFWPSKQYVYHNTVSDFRLDLEAPQNWVVPGFESGPVPIYPTSIFFAQRTCYTFKAKIDTL